MLTVKYKDNGAYFRFIRAFILPFFLKNQAEVPYFYDRCPECGGKCLCSRCFGDPADTECVASWHSKSTAKGRVILCSEFFNSSKEEKSSRKR